MLELRQLLPATFQYFELLAGSLTGLFEGGELSAQLIEVDQAVGSHVLKACAPALHLGELVRPRLRLLVGIPAHRFTFVLDHLFKPHA